MNAKKLIKTMTMTTLLSMAAVPVVWAVSGGGHIGQQHDPSRARHDIRTYGNGSGGQMMQSTPLLNSAMEQVGYARQNYRHMQSSGDPRRLAEARSLLTNAETMLTTVMADMTGVPGSRIGEMHNAGKSWHQVGVEIGIDMGPAANWQNVYGDDFHDRSRWRRTPSDQYDYHFDMHGGDTFHRGGTSAGRYGGYGSMGHGGGMMGGMH